MKSLVKTAISRAGITTQVSSINIVGAVQGFLAESVLPALLSSVRVVSFQSGILKVLCANAVSAHEIRSLESGIREVIAKTDPKAELKQLLVQIGLSKSYDL